MTFIEYLLDEDLENQEFRIDLVKRPAHEREFVSMSEEEDVIMSAFDEEKKLVVGPVIIPNKKIKRKGGRMATFSEIQITKMMNNFMNNHNNGETSLHHMYKTNDCPVTQSWQVDRSKNVLPGYGFDDLPDGTWMAAMKVNDEVWENDVKSGEVSGFSIHGTLKVEEVQMSSLDKQVWEVEKLTKDIMKGLNI